MPTTRPSRSPSERHHGIILSEHGIEKISEDDYFLKSDNFRLWLKEDRGKYFDELSGERARYYFAKFVKRWNKGHLSLPVYQFDNALSAPASSQTGYKWTFLSKTSKADRQALEQARGQIASDTYNSNTIASSSNAPHTMAGSPTLPNSATRRRVLGPSMPYGADAQLLAEEQAESAAIHSKSSRKRARAEEVERLDDMLGVSKSEMKGRDGQLEAKRARREADKSFRDARGDDGAGLDVSENVLMGGGDSFKAAIARRDAARSRAEARRQATQDERTGGKHGAAEERRNAIREKDKQTMEMLQSLAKQRFG